jgi:hypothetical protein
MPLLLVRGIAPIAQSAEGVSWVLMVVGPLMAGAGGLDLGRGNKPRSTLSEDLAWITMAEIWEIIINGMTKRL